jgi:dTMP kinase
MIPRIIRWEALERMEQLLRSGHTLIADRYAFSGVAFSAAKVFRSVVYEFCVPREL